MNKNFFKQKISLYFDENFPLEAINKLKSNKWVNKKCKIVSVFDEKNYGKDDEFQFNFCKSKGYTLITLDQEFWNDSNYPLIKMPGIVILSTKIEKLNKIIDLIKIFIDFFTNFPKPRFFIGNSKFEISNRSCIMKGRHSVTGEIKIFQIFPGESLNKVGKEFGWF